MNRKLGVVMSLAAILWMVGLMAWAWTQLPAGGHVVQRKVRRVRTVLVDRDQIGGAEPAQDRDARIGG